MPAAPGCYVADHACCERDRCDGRRRPRRPRLPDARRCRAPLSRSHTRVAHRPSRQRSSLEARSGRQPRPVGSGDRRLRAGPAPAARLGVAPSGASGSVVDVFCTASTTSRRSPTARYEGLSTACVPARQWSAPESVSRPPPRRQPARQSSTARPSTRWNARTWPVTTTRASAIACEAIHRSLGPMGVPTRSSARRTRA